MPLQFKVFISEAFGQIQTKTRNRRRSNKLQTQRIKKKLKQERTTLLSSVRQQNIECYFTSDTETQGFKNTNYLKGEQKTGETHQER